MRPEELSALADRIDHEELWRRPFSERDQMTQDQRDRMDAAVNLRRYAHDKQAVEQEKAPGRAYLRGFKLERVSSMYSNGKGCGDNAWHGAINRFQDARHAEGKEWVRWMYEAKQLSDEVPRMILLFEQERRGLPGQYKMCAHDPAPPVQLPDNHLRCHLGVECRKCEHLAAIESAPGMTNEAKDEAKAWTCAAHILLESKPDTYIEGYLHDKSEAAFNERLARSLGADGS